MPEPSPTAAPHRRLSWWWINAIVIVAILLCFAFPWKLNFLRGTIAEKVQDGTHRSFAIDGDVWLYWLQGPRLTIEGLKLGNPDWASTPQMATIAHVDATISLGNLLHQRIVLKHLELDDPAIDLEESADGKRNWYFDQNQSDSNTAIVVEELVMKSGQVAYVVKSRDTHVAIDLATITGQALDVQGNGSTSGVAAKASGRWNGMPLAAEVSTGDVLKLKDSDTPFPFKLKASIGPTRVAADGTVTGLATLKAADLKVSVSGQTLGDWSKIAGIGMPETSRYSSTGHVTIADGVYRYDDFTGTMGSSDVAGSVRFEKRDERPFVSGTLVSQQLDLTDLAPLIGKTPEPAQAPKEVDATRPRKLLPQQTFDTAKWNSIDADVHFTGKHIKNAGAIPFDNLEIHAVMQDRVLSFTPLSFGFADGHMGGDFRFDGSKSPMQAEVDARFTDLSLARLTPKVTDNSKASLGRLNGTVKLEGQGNSIAAMLATANGTAQIAMGRGRSSSLLLELVGLQGPQVVRYLLGDQNSSIRCAIGDFTVTKGDMATKTSLVDTDLNVITFVGDANFASEVLDFKITPLPKQKSIGVLRTPFYVTGAFASPDVKPDFTTLGLRAGGAVALALINPLAALIPLIEIAPGEDSDCKALLAKIRNAPVKNTDDASQSPRPAKRVAGDNADAPS